MLHRIALAASAASMLSAPALAGAVFNDRAAWESALGATPNFDSFEDLPATDSAQEFEFVRPDYTVSAINEGFEFLPPLAVQGPTGGGGTFATDGERHLNVGSLYSTADDNDVVVTFEFNEPIFGFFADITDLKGLDQAPSPRAFLETDTGLNITLLDRQDPTQDLLTIGFVTDQPVSSFVIRSTAGDSFGLDALAYGVPNPGAAGLLAVAGAFSASRRRRN